VELFSRESWSADADTFTELLDQSKRVVELLKQQFGKALVGEVRKIDRGHANRHLLHLLLVFDGPSHTELAGIRQAIIEHWKQMCQGEGPTLNLSEHHDFLYRGVSPFIRQHESLIEQMKRAITYLAETDRWVRISHGKEPGLIFGA